MKILTLLVIVQIATAALAATEVRLQREVAFAHRYLEDALRLVTKALSDREEPHVLVAAAICQSETLVCKEFACAAGTPLPTALQELFRNVDPVGRLRSRMVGEVLIVDRALPVAELQHLRRDAAATEAVGDWAQILDRIAASGDLQAVAVAFEGLVAEDPEIRRLTAAWLDWTWLCVVADPVWPELRVFVGDEAVKQRLRQLQSQDASDGIASLLRQIEAREVESAAANAAPQVTEAQVEAALDELIKGRRWPGDTLQTLRRAGSRKAIEGLFIYLERDGGNWREPALRTLIEILAEAADSEQAAADRQRLIPLLLQAVREDTLPDNRRVLAQVAAWSDRALLDGLQELVEAQQSLQPQVYDGVLDLLVAAPMNLNDPNGATCLLYASEPAATAPLARWQRYIQALTAHPTWLTCESLQTIAETAPDIELRRQAQMLLLNIPAEVSEAYWQSLLAKHAPAESWSQGFLAYLQERNAFPKDFAPHRVVQFLQRQASTGEVADRRAAASIAKTWFQYFAVNTHRGHARLDCMLDLAELLVAYLPIETDPARRGELLPEWIDAAGGAGSAQAALILERTLLSALREDPHPWVRCRAAEILARPNVYDKEADAGLTVAWRAAVVEQADRETDPAAQAILRRLLAGEKKVKLDRWPPKSARRQDAAPPTGVADDF